MDRSHVVPCPHASLVNRDCAFVLRYIPAFGVEGDCGTALGAWLCSSQSFAFLGATRDVTSIGKPGPIVHDTPARLMYLCPETQLSCGVLSDRAVHTAMLYIKPLHVCVIL